jgi:hypothetical protein
MNDPIRTSTMSASSAQICRDLDWQVGDLLECLGDVLQLTAIGVDLVLAREIKLNGKMIAHPVERAYDLHESDWEKIEQGP